MWTRDREKGGTGTIRVLLRIYRVGSDVRYREHIMHEKFIFVRFNGVVVALVCAPGRSDGGGLHKICQIYNCIK